MPKDTPVAFAALRRILKKHGAGMIVTADTPTVYTVTTRAQGPNKKPLWFGAIYSRKTGVSFHLVPLYRNPKLHATLGPDLEARMAGHACFNFKAPDAKLFAKLDRVTRAARQQWKRAGFLEPGVISAERMMAAHEKAGGSAAALAKRRATVLKRAAAKRAARKKASR